MEKKQRRERRSFSDEFKTEAVELIEKIGISRAGKELDVDTTTLRAWRKKSQTTSNPEKKSYADLEREVRRLSKENGYLIEINKVLKKSTAIFSSDQMGNLK